MSSDNAKTVFLNALEITSGEARGNYLDAQCGNDPALRAEVEELLRHHEQIGALGKSAAVVRTTPPHSLERPGMTIGPYKLLQQIGEGGMGSVYMADQTHPVQRKVALKVIKAGMDTRQVIARFEAERQALAMMDHVNIARVLDAGATDAGRPYFVMELVHGVPITKYCDDNRLTPRQRLELFVPVCQAIQHAHQKGIIHRDIKPSNVMVTLYDGKPVPKVIDFGVAKATEQKLTERTLFTQYGTMVGTLEYMSPEQAEMSALGVDTRSDIFSLGVLLYELLTGSTPLSSKRMKEAAYAEILRLIKEEEPPKPSTRLSDSGEALAAISAQRHMEPAKLSKLVRGELDWIVMKTLEKDRNRRYETASGFAADVQRYLNDEAVLAWPPSAWYRFRKLARRNKMGLTMASLVAATLFVALATLAVSNVKVNDALAKQTQALTDKTQALEALGTSKRETEAANATLKDNLEREQQAAYQHRIALAHREWLANNPDRSLELLKECPEKYRHWEWHFLYRLHHTDLMTLQHGGLVDDVAYSTDGRLLASVGAGSEVGVWDVRTGRLVRTLQSHTRQLYRVIFSPDGSRLGTSSFDGTLQVWDAATGQELLKIARPSKHLSAGLAFSPDGRQIACDEGGPNPTAAKIWDATTGEELFNWKVPEPHSGDFALQGVALSPDGKYLVPFGRGSLWLVELETKKTVKLTSSASINRVVFSRDGKRLAAAGIDGQARICQVPSGNVLLNLRFSSVDPAGRGGSSVNSASVGGFDFSPDGRHLAASFPDRSIRLLDSTNGQEVAILRGHAGGVKSVVFSPAGRQIASAGSDGMIRIWDITAPQEGPRFSAPRRAIQEVAFSGDGHRLTAVPSLYTWDLTTARLLFQRDFGNRLDAITLALSADGRNLAGSLPQQLFNFEVGTGKELFAQQRNKYVTIQLAFSPDGRLLAEGLHDGSVTVMDARTGRVIQSLQGHSRGNACVAFSPDGKRLASAGLVPNVKVWEVGTWQELYTLNGHENFVRCLSFSHDNRYLASGSMDRSICIWDAATGKKEFSLSGQADAISCVCFSLDGKRLFSCGDEGSLNVWDLQNRLNLLTLLGAGNFVTLSPDGLRLASSGHQRVQVWETELFSREERWKRHLERIPFWQPQETGKPEPEAGSKL